MDSGWLIAILLWVLLAAGFAIRAAVRLRRRLDRFERASRDRFEAFEKTLERLQWEVETAAGTCRRIERAIEALPTGAPPKPAINLSRRFQALRLYRRGERPEQIAAALGVPLREIELLIKVHQIAVDA
jgi:hypothetical protein